MIRFRTSKELEKYDSVITIQTSVGKVPLYKMIENYLWIEDADGVKIRFILNSDQVDLYESMCLQKLEHKPIRIDILKARQKGFSTFIAAVIFCMVLFTPGQKGAIVADIAEHASNLFEKYKFFYENLPESIKQRLPLKKSNAKELVVTYKGGQTSSIRIMVQGDSAGRSGTYQYLHLSECAFWADLDNTLVSLLQTVNNTNINSMVFLETTANGVNDYKMRWDNDFAGKTNYLSKFYPWFTTERYRVKKEIYSDNYYKPDWLVEYSITYDLDQYQTRWFYDKFQEFNEDLDKLHQEFPSNSVEAFIVSGNAVFNADLLRERKIEIMKSQPLKKGQFSYIAKHSLDGGAISINEVKFTESKHGSINIYQEPIIGHPYVVSNDPAMGGEDYFATQVFDNYTGVQVAVYHKNKCDADDCAYQMYCLGRYYNDAMITGETNTTSYILELCRKCGYKFIYQDQDVEELGTRFFNKLGYKTKTNNRQYMIDLFKFAFRDNPRIINDYETICEMENFQIVKHKNNTEKVEATGGAHDDLVMSVCGFFLCRNQQRVAPIENPKPKKDINYYDPYEVHKRLKQQNQRNVYQIWD